jgi:hypothetical protein
VPDFYKQADKTGTLNLVFNRIQMFLIFKLCEMCSTYNNVHTFLFPPYCKQIQTQIDNIATTTDSPATIIDKDNNIPFGIGVAIYC